MVTVQRNIELRPHEASDRSGRKVVFAQDQIFLNGMRVGYVGHQPNEGICMIRPADAETIAEIRKAVEAKRGTPAEYVITAPVISDDSDSSDE